MKDIPKTLIVVYGPIAVGKLTTAKILAQKTNFKLVHNHLLIDLVESVFAREHPRRDEMVEKLSFQFYEDVAKSGESVIITHTYDHNYVSRAGLSDPEYMKRLESVFQSCGYEAVFVHLKATQNILLSRVANEDRREFKKLTDPFVLKEDFALRDSDSSAPVTNNIVIENSDKKPEKVVEIILGHL